MEASTQVAPLPVIPSVMMLKVSEPSRATRTSGLTLQHGLRVTPESAALLNCAPMTPQASPEASSAKKTASVTSSPAAVFSPRDPSSKVAAVNPPAFAAKMSVSSAAAGYGTPSSQVVSGISAKHPTIQPPAMVVAPSTPVCMALASDSAPSSPVCKRGQASVASTPKSSSSPKSMKANTGRWTDAEHKLFLKGLETFPYRAWKKIATLIKTRTVVQIRTHAQKYYQKLEKEEARMKDREHQSVQQHGYSDRSHKEPSLSSSASSSSLCSHASDVGDYSDASSSPKPSSPAKKKTMLRKRKFTMDEDSPAVSSTPVSVATLPSLPKRMMKEKKFPREKHMSPKQKAPVSGNKFFGSSFSSPEFGPETTPRAVFGRGASAASKIPPHPLDFGDASSESMILDFADDKSIVEYPFHLDGSMDHGISSMDNDDLLQLTDEESLDWFSTTSGEQDELMKPEPIDLSTTGSSDCAADTSDSSPLTLGRYHFSPLYTEECLQFSDGGGDSSGSSPSSTMLDSCDGSDFMLSGDEDDDFVLDPEKFLSSYFSPASVN